MMRRYVLAYAVWLSAVLTAAGVALWWYKRVEQIGMEELRARFAQNGQPDEGTELVEVPADAGAA